MKTLAICHPRIKEIREDDFFSEIQISGTPITIGLVDSELVELPRDEKYAHCLLVRKIAFSCNYRDKTLMLLFNDKCHAKSDDNLIYYSPIGSEFVAEVVSVGSAVTNFEVGDKVIPNGTYPILKKGNSGLGGLPTNLGSQRFQLFTENHLVKVPNDIPDEVLASLTIGGHTVYSMLRRLTIRQGMNVLVTAATSNTSLMVLEALKKYNVNVFAVSSSLKSAEKIRAIGVKEVISSPAVDKNALLQATKRVGSFDIVIDPFFDLFINEIIKCMNFNSSYITCGFFNQHKSFVANGQVINNDFNVIMTQCMIKNISLIGNCLGSLQDLENAIRDIQLNQFKIAIDSVHQGDQIQSFFNRTFNAPDRFGKVVYKYE
jgi:NADPH:quinone reductase-like Zn-dependent oxidoreductase